MLMMSSHPQNDVSQQRACPWQPLLGMVLYGFLESFFISNYVAIDIVRFGLLLPLSTLMMLALVTGILLSALFQNTAQKIRLPYIRAAICAFGGALLLFAGLLQRENEAAFLLTATVLVGTLLPPLLTLFFTSLPSWRQAVMLSMAHALGELCSLFFLHLVTQVFYQSAYVPFAISIGLLLCLAGLFVHLACTGGLPPAIRPPVEPRVCWPGMRFCLPVLLAASILFYMLHSLHDANFRFYIHFYTGSPLELRLLTRLTFPLLGLVALRFGLFPLAALSLAFSAFAPAIGLYPPTLEGPNILLSVLDNIGYHGGFFFLLLATARMAETHKRPALIRSLPYMTMYGVFALVYAFGEWFSPDTRLQMLLSMFILGATIAVVGWWRQLEQPESGSVAPITPEQTVSEACLAEALPLRPVHWPGGRLGVFATHYGISPRETEVLELLCKGLSYAQMANKLCIAENTTKIHVSRILKKTGVKSRQQLLGRLVSLDDA